MKLDVIKREIADITVTDGEVIVALELGVSHGAVKKSVTPITVEHTVPMEDVLTDGAPPGIDDAIVLAIAGVNRRADEAIAALRGLTTL